MTYNFIINNIDIAVENITWQRKSFTDGTQLVKGPWECFIEAEYQNNTAKISDISGLDVGPYEIKQNNVNIVSLMYFKELTYDKDNIFITLTEKL